MKTGRVAGWPLEIILGGWYTDVKGWFMKKCFFEGEMRGALFLLCALFLGCKAVGTVTDEDIVVRLAREFVVSPASLNFVLAEEPPPRTVTAHVPRVSENITLQWTASPENIVELTPVQADGGRQVIVTPLAPGCAVLRAKINEYTVYADCNVTVREAGPNALGANALRKFYVRDNTEIVYSGAIQSDKKTILLELPLSFNLEALRPAVFHDGVSYAPQGVVDFRNSQDTPVIYTVTAANGEKAAYQVTAVRTNLKIADFLSIDANGVSGVTTTTTLTMHFKADATFWLDLNDIQIEPPGAAKFTWKENDNAVLTVTIEGIKENDIDLTLVPVKKGYVFNPLSQTVRVYKGPS
jgi:hypothetical protein